MRGDTEAVVCSAVIEVAMLAGQSVSSVTRGDVSTGSDVVVAGCRLVFVFKPRAFGAGDSDGDDCLEILLLPLSPLAVFG